MSGTTYTFATTYELIVTLCRQGRVVQSRHAWTLSEARDGTGLLAITGLGAYRLTFEGDPRPRLMRLRAARASAPPEEKAFSLDED